MIGTFKVLGESNADPHRIDSLQLALCDPYVLVLIPFCDPFSLCELNLQAYFKQKECHRKGGMSLPR
jgi:hypothetical protein